MRYDFQRGLKSRDAATDALETAYANGDVVQCQRPEVEPYSVTLRDGSKARRFKITIEE